MEGKRFGVNESIFLFGFLLEQCVIMLTTHMKPTSASLCDTAITLSPQQLSKQTQSTNVSPKPELHSSDMFFVSKHMLFRV